MRRGKATSTHAKGTQERIDHAGRGGLPIRSSDVNAGVAILRVTQDVQGFGHAVKGWLNLVLRNASDDLLVDFFNSLEDCCCVCGIVKGLAVRIFCTAFSQLFLPVFTPLRVVAFELSNNGRIRPQKHGIQSQSFQGKIAFAHFFLLIVAD